MKENSSKKTQSSKRLKSREGDHLTIGMDLGDRQRGNDPLPELSFGPCETEARRGRTSGQCEGHHKVIMFG